MRYVGQGHDLQIDLPGKPVASAPGQSDTFVSMLSNSFEDAYKSIFGRALSDHPIEVLTWTVTATVDADLDDRTIPFQSPSDRPEPVGTARLYDPDAGSLVKAPIYWRSSLPSGFTVDGPTIIAEQETSTVVTACFALTVHDQGHLVLTAKTANSTARG